MHNFFRHALLSCSEILTYQLLSSQPWIVLSTENSRYRHLSRGKHANHAITHEQILITKIFTIHFQANIDFSLCCSFQHLVFSERREILPTDRQIHRYTNRLLYAPWLRPPRHNDNRPLFLSKENATISENNCMYR